MMSYLILNTPGAYIKLRLPLTALATSCGFVGQFGSPNSKGMPCTQCARSAHTVRTQCEVLNAGQYSDPTFGPF